MRIAQTSDGFHLTERGLIDQVHSDGDGFEKTSPELIGGPELIFSLIFYLKRDEYLDFARRETLLTLLRIFL